MKRLLIIAFCSSISVCAFGQFASTGKTASSKESEKRTIDVASLRCYYVFNKKKVGEAQPFRTDTMVLNIGNKVSVFYDPARLGRDSLLGAKMKQMNTMAVKSVNVYRADAAKDLSSMIGTTGSNSSEGESYQIIKNKPSNKISVIDYAKVIGDRFKYEDDLGQLPWKVSNETKTILSYACQKATLNFRGRNYTAWFTTDIPVNDGPWKFSGLPGLILNVEDDQSLFSFSLIGLEQLSPGSPILIDDANSIACSRADFEKLKKKQGGGMQINFNSGDVLIAEIPAKDDFKPMETE